MANTKSADKRARQALKRRDRNRDHVSTMRTAVKRLRKAVASGDAKTAQDLLGNTVKVVDSTPRRA
jgi:small subunit ribosomal protein S20